MSLWHPLVTPMDAISMSLDKFYDCIIAFEGRYYWLMDIEQAAQ